MFAIPDISAQRAAIDPGKIALRDLDREVSISYSGFEERSSKVTRLLADLGVNRGDRVAILCRNRIEFFELLFGCAKLGAVLVPLNWRMPAGELTPLVEDAAPVVLFFGSEDAAVASQIGAANQLIGLDEDYASRRDGARSQASRRFWPADETWYLLYTSGTTGKPKGVIYTYGMTIANYINIGQAMAIGSDDVTLNFLPLFHTAGINLVTLPTFIAGGEALILPGFDVDRTVKLLADGAIDTFFGVPAVYQQISLHTAFDELRLDNVRSWGCGGAPLPVELIDVFLARGASVCNGMGMTETGPTVFLMDPASVAQKTGSVGKPQVLASVRIVDRDGQDVPTGETGELLFAGPNVTPGYWRREDVNAEAYTGDGWLKSGDIARCDEDGFYFIIDRIKDMFISGGENVYPAEVEKVLAGHPDILEAAVVPMPDRQWGEVGCAHFLLRPGHEYPGDDELRQYCRRLLAGYKVPKRFLHATDFPRTAAGKVQKHLLVNADE